MARVIKASTKDTFNKRKKTGTGGMQTSKGKENLRGASRKQFRSKRLRELANPKVSSSDNQVLTEEEEEENQLLLKLPKLLAEDVSVKGYERHIACNKIRISENLKATDSVEKSEQDMEEDTKVQEQLYDALLTSEVKRYIKSNHLDQALREKSMVARNQHAYEVAEREAKARADADAEEARDARETKTKLDAGSKKSEMTEATELSQEEIGCIWEKFISEGIFIKKQLEKFDPKHEDWYEARVTKIVQDGVPKDKLTSSELQQSGADVSFRYYGFKPPRYGDLKFQIYPQKWEIDHLKESSEISPPLVNTRGVRFPTSRAKKPRKVQPQEIQIEEEVEGKPEKGSVDTRVVQDLSKLDQTNILESSRRGRALRKRPLVKEEAPRRHAVATVCGICGENCYLRDIQSMETLKLCEGGCNMVYHAPCLGLEDHRDGPFVCNLCETHEHGCQYCLDAGTAPPLERTIRCSFQDCTKFYHPACVKEHVKQARVVIKSPKSVAIEDSTSVRSKRSKTSTPDASKVESEGEPKCEFEETQDQPSSQNDLNESKQVGPTLTSEVEMEHVAERVDVESPFCDVAETGQLESSQRPEPKSEPELAYDPDFQFICPSHCCLACFKDEEESVSDAQGKPTSGKVKACIFCHRGYHEKCIPYGSLRNDLGLMCNMCAREYDPPVCGTSDTSFLTQLSQRKKKEVTIDFARYLQKQSLDLSVEEARAFRLPAELVQEKQPNKKKKVATPRKKASKPPKYVPLRKNAYAPGVRPVVNKSTFEQKCQCINTCDERCMNKLLRIECVDSKAGSNCNCSQNKCKNRQFQTPDQKKLHPVETPGIGWGLEIDEDVSEGDFVIEYMGEVVSAAEARRRQQQSLKSKERHVFQMDVGGDRIIDARYKGNLARFINHSCDPNCVLHKWNVGGITRIGIFALRSIRAGEELSFDYSFQKSTELTFDCLCGAANCRGTLSTVTNRDSEAKRNFDVVCKKISTLKRMVKQARGGVLKRQTLRKFVLSEIAELSKVTEERIRRSRRCELKVRRNTTARQIIDYLPRVDLNYLYDIVRQPNPPFLMRNLNVGRDLLERLKLRKARLQRSLERKGSMSDIS